MAQPEDTVQTAYDLVADDYARLLPDTRAETALDLTVASLADLPFEDGRFAGVMAWYSTIHTPDEELPGVLAELVRVLRPGGHLLVAFQAGEGVVDLAESYGRHGHGVVLERYRRTVGTMADLLVRAGCREVARMVRAPEGKEAEGQAVLLVTRSTPAPARGATGSGSSPG